MVPNLFVIPVRPCGVQTGKTVKLSKFQGIFGKPVSLNELCWGQICLWIVCHLGVVRQQQQNRKLSMRSAAEG